VSSAALDGDAGQLPSREGTEVPMIAAEQLAEVFVEMADTLVDDFDLVDFLDTVTSTASELGGARAAGLLLADERGGLQLMAASDQRAEMLELFQIQAMEGPCHDCYRQGSAVVNADLRAASARWPQFAPRAVAAGYRSVHAFPMRLRRDVIGALNLFGTEAVDLHDGDVRVIQALADVATIGLLQERSIRQSEDLASQLQAALSSRVVVEQAKGALAQIHGGTPDEGFERLRRYCRSRHLRLSDVARAVLADPASIPELTEA
jgi:transcriptional regulator with GAF, ATPase, and Fis domain